MKRIIGLVLLCFLFASCTIGWGELVIYNQTSKNIAFVKYCGKTFGKETDVNAWEYDEVDVGAKVSDKFPDEETGYVYFRILGWPHTFESPYDRKYVDVRTNEIVTVPKGKKTVFFITDNTLVIISGKSKPITLADVMQYLY